MTADVTDPDALEELRHETQKHLGLIDFVAAVAGTPLGRIGEPDDVAEAVLYLLSDASSWMTGTTIDINGGFAMR